MKVNPKILVNRSGALGDVLMVTPIIRRLYRKRFGECQIYIKSFYTEIFLNNPFHIYDADRYVHISNSLVREIRLFNNN